LLKKCRSNDVVFIEGLKKLVALKNKIPKIVVAKSKRKVVSALETLKPVLAFSGPYSAEAFSSEVPCVDGLKNPQKLADIVEKAMLKK
jgi:molybdopterin-guanine dinucleotide biosynthesis protein